MAVSPGDPKGERRRRERGNSEVRESDGGRRREQKSGDNQLATKLMEREKNNETSGWEGKSMKGKEENPGKV